MTEIELELFQLRMRAIILERLVLKTHLLAVLATGQTLEQAVRATLSSIEIDDESLRLLFAPLKMDSAQTGLRMSELTEIVDRMRAYVIRIAKELQQATQ